MTVGRRAIARRAGLTSCAVLGALALAVAAQAALFAPTQSDLGPRGSVEIRRPFAGSDIVLRASTRVAGAIDSLTWRGTEFINSYDHGRELQSAASFDRLGECFNPTEAGSRDDGAGSTSSSALISIHVDGPRLITRTRMAFWLAPGETCRGARPARNDRVLSDYELVKRVTIGARGRANAIEHAVTFHIPAAHERGTFEALTSYLPPTFSQFWTYDPLQDRRAALSDGPGLQPLPVIFATPAGDFALGVYSAGLRQPGLTAFGFGRWRFAQFKEPGNATVKWSCVFRMQDIVPGDYRFTCYSIVGTLDQVKETMRKLAQPARLPAR